MSIHDRAQKIVTDLAVVSLWDNQAQEKAIEQIKKLCLDCFDRGRQKAEEWEKTSFPQEPSIKPPPPPPPPPSRVIREGHQPPLPPHHRGPFDSP